MWLTKVVLLLNLAFILGAAKGEEEVLVQLPDLGHIKGRVVKTLGSGGRPQRTYYNFRNIPFAQSVSGPHRFSVIFMIWH